MPHGRPQRPRSRSMVGGAHLSVVVRCMCDRAMNGNFLRISCCYFALRRARAASCPCASELREACAAVSVIEYVDFDSRSK